MLLTEKYFGVLLLLLAQRYRRSLILQYAHRSTEMQLPYSSAFIFMSVSVDPSPIHYVGICFYV